jgi:hypothetical protein
MRREDKGDRKDEGGGRRREEEEGGRKNAKWKWTTTHYFAYFSQVNFNFANTNSFAGFYHINVCHKRTFAQNTDKDMFKTNVHA